MRGSVARRRRQSSRGRSKLGTDRGAQTGRHHYLHWRPADCFGRTRWMVAGDARLANGIKAFDVVVNRAGRDIQLRLSCRNHERYFQAERRVWTSITHREWDECISAAVSAMRAFGRTTSPMIQIALQYATAARWDTDRRARLVDAYAIALLDEMPAVAPEQRPGLKQAVLNAIGWLEKAGAADSATDLRRRLAAAGSPP
jgi:hypothetical protein